MTSPQIEKIKQGLSYNEYLPHQVSLIERMCKKCREQKGILLVHSMGSGKTLSALGIALNFEYKKKGILILTPPGLDVPFKADMADINITKEEQKQMEKDKKLLFYNYNQLTGKEKIGNKSNLDIIKQISDDMKDKIIIVDEAHNLVNIIKKFNNENKQNFNTLLLDGFDSSFKNILLSGTPIQKGFDDLTLLASICAGYENKNTKSPFYPTHQSRIIQKYPNDFTVNLKIKQWALDERNLIKIIDMVENTYRFGRIVAASLGVTTGGVGAVAAGVGSILNILGNAIYSTYQREQNSISYNRNNIIEIGGNNLSQLKNKDGLSEQGESGSLSSFLNDNDTEIQMASSEEGSTLVNKVFTLARNVRDPTDIAGMTGMLRGILESTRVMLNENGFDITQFDLNKYASDIGTNVSYFNYEDLDLDQQNMYPFKDLQRDGVDYSSFQLDLFLKANKINDIINDDEDLEFLNYKPQGVDPFYLQESVKMFENKNINQEKLTVIGNLSEDNYYYVAQRDEKYDIFGQKLFNKYPKILLNEDLNLKLNEWNKLIKNELLYTANEGYQEILIKVDEDLTEKNTKLEALKNVSLLSKMKDMEIFDKFVVTEEEIQSINSFKTKISESDLQNIKNVNVYKSIIDNDKILPENKNKITERYFNLFSDFSKSWKLNELPQEEQSNFDNIYDFYANMFISNNSEFNDMINGMIDISYFPFQGIEKDICKTLFEGLDNPNQGLIGTFKLLINFEIKNEDFSNYFNINLSLIKGDPFTYISYIIYIITLYKLNFTKVNIDFCAIYLEVMKLSSDILTIKTQQIKFNELVKKLRVLNPKNISKKHMWNKISEVEPVVVINELPEQCQKSIKDSHENLGSDVNIEVDLQERYRLLMKEQTLRFEIDKLKTFTEKKVSDNVSPWNNKTEYDRNIKNYEDNYLHKANNLYKYKLKKWNNYWVNFKPFTIKNYSDTADTSELPLTTYWDNKLFFIKDDMSDDEIISNDLITKNLFKLFSIYYFLQERILYNSEILQNHEKFLYGTDENKNVLYPTSFVVYKDGICSLNEQYLNLSKSPEMNTEKITYFCGIESKVFNLINEIIYHITIFNELESLPDFPELKDNKKKSTSNKSDNEIMLLIKKDLLENISISVDKVNGIIDSIQKDLNDENNLFINNNYLFTTTETYTEQNLNDSNQQFTSIITKMAEISNEIFRTQGKNLNESFVTMIENLSKPNNTETNVSDLIVNSSKKLNMPYLEIKIDSIRQNPNLDDDYGNDINEFLNISANTNNLEVNLFKIINVSTILYKDKINNFAFTHKTQLESLNKFRLHNTDVVLKKSKQNLTFCCNKYLKALNHILDERKVGHYLPVFYSNFDKYGFQTFSAFLTELGFYHFVISTDDPTEVRERLGDLAGYAYRRFKKRDEREYQDEGEMNQLNYFKSFRPMTYDEENNITPGVVDRLRLDRYINTEKDDDRFVPLCIVLHPDIVEGLSFHNSTKIVVNETIPGYGRSEQLYARILRQIRSGSEFDATKNVNNDKLLVHYSDKKTANQDLFLFKYLKISDILQNERSINNNYVIPLQSFTKGINPEIGQYCLYKNKKICIITGINPLVIKITQSNIDDELDNKNDGIFTTTEGLRNFHENFEVEEKNISEELIEKYHITDLTKQRLKLLYKNLTDKDIGQIELYFTDYSKNSNHLITDLSDLQVIEMDVIFKIYYFNHLITEYNILIKSKFDDIPESNPGPKSSGDNLKKAQEQLKRAQEFKKQTEKLKESKDLKEYQRQEEIYKKISALDENQSALEKFRAYRKAIQEQRQVPEYSAPVSESTTPVPKSKTPVPKSKRMLTRSEVLARDNKDGGGLTEYVNSNLKKNTNQALQKLLSVIFNEFETEDITINKNRYYVDFLSKISQDIPNKQILTEEEKDSVTDSEIKSYFQMDDSENFEEFKRSNEKGINILKKNILKKKVLEGGATLDKFVTYTDLIVSQQNIIFTGNYLVNQTLSEFNTHDDINIIYKYQILNEIYANQISSTDYITYNQKNIINKIFIFNNIKAQLNSITENKNYSRPKTFNECSQPSENTVKYTSSGKKENNEWSYSTLTKPNIKTFTIKKNYELSQKVRIDPDPIKKRTSQRRWTRFNSKSSEPGSIKGLLGFDSSKYKTQSYYDNEYSSNSYKKNFIDGQLDLALFEQNIQEIKDEIEDLDNEKLIYQYVIIYKKLKFILKNVDKKSYRDYPLKNMDQISNDELSLIMKINNISLKETGFTGQVTEKNYDTKINEIFKKFENLKKPEELIDMKKYDDIDELIRKIDNKIIILDKKLREAPQPTSESGTFPIPNKLINLYTDTKIENNVLLKYDKQIHDYLRALYLKKDYNNQKIYISGNNKKYVLSYDIPKYYMVSDDISEIISYWNEPGYESDKVNIYNEYLDRFEQGVQSDLESKFMRDFASKKYIYFRAPIYEDISDMETINQCRRKVVLLQNKWSNRKDGWEFLSDSFVKSSSNMIYELTKMKSLKESIEINKKNDQSVRISQDSILKVPAFFDYVMILIKENDGLNKSEINEYLIGQSASMYDVDSRDFKDKWYRFISNAQSKQLREDAIKTLKRKGYERYLYDPTYPCGKFNLQVTDEDDPNLKSRTIADNYTMSTPDLIVEQDNVLMHKSWYKIQQNFKVRGDKNSECQNKTTANTNVKKISNLETRINELMLKINTSNVSSSDQKEALFKQLVSTENEIEHTLWTNECKLWLRNINPSEKLVYQPLKSGVQTKAMKKLEEDTVPSEEQEAIVENIYHLLRGTCNKEDTQNIVVLLIKNDNTTEEIDLDSLKLDQINQKIQEAQDIQENKINIEIIKKYLQIRLQFFSIYKSKYANKLLLNHKIFINKNMKIVSSYLDLLKALYESKYILSTNLDKKFYNTLATDGTLSGIEALTYGTLNLPQATLNIIFDSLDLLTSTAKDVVTNFSTTAALGATMLVPLFISSPYLLIPMAVVAGLTVPDNTKWDDINLKNLNNIYNNYFSFYKDCNKGVSGFGEQALCMLNADKKISDEVKAVYDKTWRSFINSIKELDENRQLFSIGILSSVIDFGELDLTEILPENLKFHINRTQIYTKITNFMFSTLTEIVRFSIRLPTKLLQTSKSIYDYIVKKQIYKLITYILNSDLSIEDKLEKIEFLQIDSDIAGAHVDSDVIEEVVQSEEGKRIQQGGSIEDTIQFLNENVRINPYKVKYLKEWYNRQ